MVASRCASAALAAVLAVGFSLRALGQGATASDSSSTGAPEVEEILVTASGRPADIQAVPIAVSAFTASELRLRGVDETQELVLVSPSLDANTASSATFGGTLRIRGVGTSGNNLGLEAAVGTFVDGVYRSRSGHGFSDLLDVERIEVLRGPQGTLFGRNTSAGALHVITKSPNLRELEGSIAGEYGSYDHRRLAASVSGPIVAETLGFRLAASWTRRDGSLPDANRDEAYDDRDRWSLRGNLLWKSERASARLIADFRQQDEACCQAIWAVAGSTRPLVATLAGALGLGDDVPSQTGVVPSRRRAGVTPGHEPFEDVKDGGVSLELTRDFGRLRLSSISAWRKLDLHLAQDADSGSAAILEPALPDGQHQQFVNFSQELRATGTAWERLDWLVGVYGYTEDTNRRQRPALGAQGGLYQDALVGAAIPSLAPISEPGHYPHGGGALNESTIATSGWAIFLHNNYRPVERLELGVGVRYSSERKRARVSVNGGTPGPIVGDPALAPPSQVRNDPTPAALPGATLPWCEQLTASGLNLVRTRIVQGFCDNVSWSGDKHERTWSYTASIAYLPGDDLTLYASYARGHKAGGFNTDSDAVDLANFGTPAAAIVDGSRFEPEYADAYEIGVKWTLWDGRARTNLTGFYTELEDFQLNTFTGQGFILSNVAEVTSKGVELEAFVSPLDGLQLTLGVTYADARYGDDVDQCFPLQDPFGRVNRCTPEGGTPGANDTPPGFFAEDFRIDGKRLTNAPRWAGSGSITYERALVREWVAFGSLNASLRDERNANPALHPLAAEESHWLVNLQGGVRSPDERWELTIWTTNLTNELERGLIFNTPMQGGTLHAFVNPPRMWGGTLRYEF